MGRRPAAATATPLRGPPRAPTCPPRGSVAPPSGAPLRRQRAPQASRHPPRDPGESAGLSQKPLQAPLPEAPGRAPQERPVRRSGRGAPGSGVPGARVPVPPEDSSRDRVERAARQDGKRGLREEERQLPFLPGAPRARGPPSPRAAGGASRPSCRRRGLGSGPSGPLRGPAWREQAAGSVGRARGGTGPGPGGSAAWGERLSRPPRRGVPWFTRGQTTDGRSGGLGAGRGGAPSLVRSARGSRDLSAPG